MTLNQIATAANNLCDENYSATLILEFVNQAIARINATINAKLPVFTALDVDYTAINDNWQRLLFISYASYAIKTNDGSLNEADRFRRDFETNFNLLQENRLKAIPTAYQDTYFGGIYQVDTTVGINVGWFKKDKTNGDW